MTPADLKILLHIIKSFGQIDGRKRLQKIICIAKYQYNLPFSYEFKPHFYGPYSEDLTSSIESLRSSGFVQEMKQQTLHIHYSYSLTEKGIRYVERLNDKSLEKEILKLQELKSMEINELVKLSKKILPQYYEVT
jgi:uncharacterized protein YwgA